PDIPLAHWRGDDVRGKRMLVFAEQGLGDIIQFARYVPLLSIRGAHVTFLVPPKLLKLLKPLERIRHGAKPAGSQKTKLLPLLSKGAARRDGAQGSVSVIPSLPMSGVFDLQCALASLPLNFG